MKVHGNISVGKKKYSKGDDVPWLFVYPFFLFHMLIFGGSGFLIAYGADDCPIWFLYLHGGFAIFVYTIFYLAIFGVDEVKWMFINAVLGVFGMYSQIDWVLSLFDKNIENYPIYVHVIPFLYFVLYTFLLRQAVLDITGSRESGVKQKFVEFLYISSFVVVYCISYLSK